MSKEPQTTNPETSSDFRAGFMLGCYTMLGILAAVQFFCAGLRP
jgi:hypothetical protein